MGHYYSEMESLGEGRVRSARDNRRAALFERGYRFDVADQLWGLIYLGDRKSLMHAPCGLMVGDPDVHDRYCPAKESNGS